MSWPRWWSWLDRRADSECSGCGYSSCRSSDDDRIDPNLRATRERHGFPGWRLALSNASASCTSQRRARHGPQTPLALASAIKPFTATAVR